MSLLRLFTLRLAILITASLGLVVLLSQVHDYPQTRSAISDHQHGDGLAWLIGFYFINEASSGIKYALTGDKKHLSHYPRGDDRSDFDRYNREYRDTLRRAARGSWKKQLQISHLHALGWGALPVDKAHATEWYLRAQARAVDLGQQNEWRNNSRRKQVRSLIMKELSLSLLSRQLPETYRISETIEEDAAVG